MSDKTKLRIFVSLSVIICIALGFGTYTRLEAIKAHKAELAKIEQQKLVAAQQKAESEKKAINNNDIVIPEFDPASVVASAGNKTPDIDVTDTPNGLTKIQDNPTPTAPTPKPTKPVAPTTPVKTTAPTPTTPVKTTTPTTTPVKTTTPTPPANATTPSKNNHEGEIYIPNVGWVKGSESDKPGGTINSPDAGGDWNKSVGNM